MRTAILALLLVSASEARADRGFVEPHVGIMIPVADDEYTDAADESLKLGVRIGSGSDRRALDLGIDYTPVNDELSTDIIEVDVSRFRFQIGGRFIAAAGDKARLFGRISAGLDLIRYSASGNVFGIEVDQSETDPGLAVEAQGGVLFDLGSVMLAAWVGVPMAFHFDDDDPDVADDADLEYTGIDIDLAVGVAIPF